MNILLENRVINEASEMAWNYEQILGCAATNISNEQVGKPGIFPQVYWVTVYRKRAYRRKPTNNLIEQHSIELYVKYG